MERTANRSGAPASTFGNLIRGSLQSLEREQWVGQPPDRVFDFFSDPYNLERLTPPFLRFRVLRSSTAKVGEGTTIDYRLRLRGIPLRWRSLIEEWRPGRRFVDRQLRGPYALWHHTHEFEPHGGGTLIRDLVRYRVPFGLAGQVLAGRWVRRDVEEIFRFRQERIRQLFPDTSELRADERRASS